ncbi:phage tail tip lysozyme [Jiella sp. M17.18]|uniref:phage tail tip lysozyme n=1 Tax=Jiella sp. M17.18 TaxID=3234247 RepID=UPI0034DDE420
MSGETLKDFLVGLGFDIDRKSEEKFKSTIRGAALQAKLLADGIEALVRTVAEGVQKIGRDFDTLYWSSQRVGASATNLKAFAYGMSQIGGSAQGALATVEKFASTLRTSPGAVSYMKQLGIADGKDSVEEMISLVQKLYAQHHGSPGQYAIGSNIAQQIFGIDEQTYYQISHHADALRKRIQDAKDTNKAFGLDPDAAAKKWKNFINDLNEVKNSVQVLIEKIATDLEPQLDAGLKEFQKWLIANKDNIKKFLLDVGGAAKTVASDLGELATQLKPIWEGFDHITKSLTGKGGLVAALEILIGLLAFRGMAKLFGGMGAAASNPVGWGIAALLGYDAAGLPHLTQNPMAEPGPGDHVVTPDEYTKHFMGPGDVWRWIKRKVWGGPGDGTGDVGHVPSSAEKQKLARESYDFWIKKGLPRNAALGMVATEQGESGFNPHATGDGGSAMGSFQWHADRRAAILRGTGIDVASSKTTHDQMLQAALWEMKNGDAGAQKAYRRVQNADSPSQAAAILTYYFERPRDKKGQARIRGGYANRWAQVIDDNTQEANAADVAKEARVPDLKKNAADLTTRIYKTVAGAIVGGASAAEISLPDQKKIADRINGAFGTDKQGMIQSRINGAFDTTLGGNVTNNSKSVTLHQKTDITVNGATDPHGTAAVIGERQGAVNGVLLRNTQSAVR